MLSLLVRQFHDRLIPAYFLMGAAMIGLAVSVFVKETASRSLRGSTPVVADTGEIGDVLARPSDAIWWEEEPEAPSQRGMGGKDDVEQGVSRER